MTDRLPGAPGRHIGVVDTDQLQKLQKGEPFTITLTRDDAPVREGTPYSKAAVLPEDVAQMLCAGIEDPTPADAFRSAAQALYQITAIEFQQGSISGQSGNTITATNRCRSDFIGVCGDELCCSNNADYKIFGHFYGADGTYLGNTGWVQSFALADYVEAKPGLAQLRIVIGHTDDKSISASTVSGVCRLFYSKLDRTCGKVDAADLGSKDVFALSPFVIYEGGYHGQNGFSVDQEGCSVYRLYLGEDGDVDYTYLFGKTIKIKTYAYGDMAYGFEGEPGTLINPDADIENDPESGVCEFEVTLPDSTEDLDLYNFFHVSFCENAYTGFEIYEKKGSAWEEIKALWQAANALTAQQLMYEITKMRELYSEMNDRVAALEANIPAVYDGSVTVE